MHFVTKKGQGSFGLPTHAHATQISDHRQNHKQYQKIIQLRVLGQETGLKKANGLLTLTFCELWFEVHQP